MQVAIKDIKVSERIRKDVGDIEELARSINKVGLIHPIIISEDYQLLSGYRRLQACKSLGWIAVDAHIAPSVADDELSKLDWEYHENIGRKDLDEIDKNDYAVRREALLKPKKVSFWTKIVQFLKSLLFFLRKK